MANRAKDTDRREMATEAAKTERKRVKDILEHTDTYSPLLDPMIDTYIDIYEVYTLMFERWKDNKFQATRTHTNQGNNTNITKDPLSVQVDIWNEKKVKALEKLGMTNKALSKKVITGGTTVDTGTGVAEKETEAGNTLISFKKKWAK